MNNLGSWHLALDTLGDTCSVALTNGEQYWTASVSTKKHSHVIHHGVSEVMEAASCRLSEVSLWVANIGPGSFTGVRIGLAAIKGYSLAHDTPILPLCHLYILADQAYNTIDQEGGHHKMVNHVCVCEDARMGEIYVGHYQVIKNQLYTIKPVELISPKSLHALYPPQDCLKVGDGWKAYHDLLPSSWHQADWFNPNNPAVSSKAITMLRIANRMLKQTTVSLEDAKSLKANYLRLKVTR
ncbi:MAG: tRNA (adenosine(37)-N6)-threonylcarbamoyltransferase complex dimerization subunit type 1 TsaB [Pseudomonadota bacterium]|nr:tRNA (adenosine(37)-N6)-threonylcarbamoyltransferase complex dimerization subunit type 1 TsaB [Pseudomonadota bacterium]